ncbi:hypothetical protein NNL21_29415 [Paenibacillus mendelii]|nr:hypothetical protein [Paenibacillus mendelii]
MVIVMGNGDVRAYNSVILLYGNDSPYGAINDELFQIVEADLPTSSSAALLADQQPMHQ